MSTINWLFELNFAIFSVFLVLYVTELMGGVLLILSYDAVKEKVLPYIVPIWEVTGTFAAFWVVTADFAYPAMLIPVATLLAGPIVVFLLLFVARNAMISFAELITRRGGWINEKRLYQLYGLATLLIGVVVIMVLSMIVTAAGVTLSPLSFSVWGWVTNAGSVPYLLGVILIALGLAPVFYDIAPLRKITLPLTTLGVLAEVAALYLYSSSFVSAWIVLPAVLTIVAALLYNLPPTAAIVSKKIVFALVATVAVFSLNYLVYPTFLNGALSVDAVTTHGPMVGAFYGLTAVGFIVVGLLMALYMLSAWRSGKATSPVPIPARPGAPAGHNP